MQNYNLIASTIIENFSSEKGAHCIPVECLHVLTDDRGDLHPRLVVVPFLGPDVLPQEGVGLDVERARFLRGEERGRYLNEGATHK